MRTFVAALSLVIGFGAWAQAPSTARDAAAGPAADAAGRADDGRGTDGAPAAARRAPLEFEDVAPAVDTSPATRGAAAPDADTSPATRGAVARTGTTRTLREAVAPSPAAPAAPRGAEVPATARVMDSLDLGTTSITGNQELPKVLYIVPWKRSDLGDLVGRPVNTLLDEVLAPVDPEVFERQLAYYESLYGETLYGEGQEE
jgi:hypothetical protein